MFTVLFVDDEIWALKGLSKMFDWKSLGFEVIAETTKSSEALKLILEKEPDVAFIDVRMPVISGIEMMKKVREQGLKTEFIVVSGFSEFSYAKEAIKYGAFDYCLKPIEYNDIKALIDRLIPHLEQKKSRENHDLFEELIDARENIDELLQKNGFFKKEYPSYQLLILESHESLFIQKDIPCRYMTISIGKQKKLYFINTGENIMEYPQQSKLQGGISTLYEKPNFLQMYMEADIAFHNKWIRPLREVFFYKNKNITEMNGILDRIFFHMEKGDTVALRETVEGIPDEFREKQLNLNDAVYLWNQIAAYVNKKYAEDPDAAGFDFMDYQQLVSQYQNFETFCDSVAHDLLLLMNKQLVLDNTNDTMNVNFNKMLQYIRDNIQESLYLQDLARKFFINRNYCCYLFKKHTGSTFSEYVNSIRMEKSKELLRDMNYSIEEISEMVGYNDYFYFNRVFKKQYGVTPSQYRKNYLASRQG